MRYEANTDDAPARYGRHVEAQQLMIALGDLERRCAVTVLLGQPFDLVVEDIGEPLQE